MELQLYNKNEIEIKSIEIAIANCESVQEIKQNIFPKIAGILELLLQAGILTIEQENKLRALKSKAELKLAKLLNELEKIQGGDHKSKDFKNDIKTGLISEYKQILKNYNINEREAQRLQEIIILEESDIDELEKRANDESRKLLKKDMFEKVKNENAIKIKKENINKNEIKMPDNVFEIILIDPPWKYSNTGFEMSAEKKYPTMSVDEIIEKINFTTSKNAVLFLWVTNPFVEEAMDLVRAWDFEYKTNFVWCKKNHTAGFYILGQHELLLICVKGNGMLPEIKYKSIIECENNIHSKKPEIVYDMIEKMYPNKKYLEIFARNKRKGWAYYGNEII